MARANANPRRVRVALSLLLWTSLSACSVLSGTFQAEDAGGEPEGVPIDVELQGVRQVATWQLLRAIEDRMYDLSRHPDSEAIVQDAAFDVEDFYRQEGFPDVRVGTEVQPLPGREGRKLLIVVEEGPEVTVRSMRVEGAASYDREELLAFWLQRGSGALGFGDPLYIESDVLGFAQSLRLFLRGQGWLDAVVSAPDVTRSEDREQVDIVVRIDEGTRYVVGEVDVDPAIREALGGASIPSPSGEPAVAKRIDDYRTAIREALRRRGRPEPRVQVSLSRREAGSARFVDVSVRGRPGRVARIDSIAIEGLEETNESVVRDLLEFEAGDVFDGAKFDESLRELYLTGLFQRVDVETTWVEGGPDDEGDGRLRVQLTIKEEDSQTIEALVGYGSYEGARAKLRYEEANLFGTGRGFTAEGRASQKGWRGLATVTDRDFLGTGTRLSISGDVLRREEPSFVDRAYGGTVAFRREITERWNTRVGYTYRLHDGLTNDALTPAASITRYVEGSPFIETRFDTRDSQIYPRDGLQIAAQFDVNDPAFGADIEFTRVRFAASYYIPLSHKASIALRTDQGWLWPGETSDDVPLQERFYNGGENTVRSFRESKLGPLDVNGTPLGGEYRNVFGAELRANLIRTLEGALFVDAGNVGSSVENYGFSNMRFAIGGGLRLALPIGPVRVDAGWNPDREPGEKEWVVHLSVGYPF